MQSLATIGLHHISAVNTICGNIQCKSTMQDSPSNQASYKCKLYHFYTWILIKHNTYNVCMQEEQNINIQPRHISKVTHCKAT